MLNKTLTEVIKLNDIKIILRVHMFTFNPSQEEKKLATHDSHENTMEKEKGKVFTKVFQKIFQKMMIPFSLASLL